MAIMCLTSAAQNLTLRGVYQTSRDDDYPNGFYSEYVGWNYELGKAIFIVQQGLYKMEWDGSTLAMPEKYPAVNPYAYCAGDLVNYVEPSDLIILWGQFMRMAVPAVGWIMV